MVLPLKCAALLHPFQPIFAESCGRESVVELKRFLTITAGSSSELQYQCILSKDLNYLNETIFKELFDEISQIKRMIFGYAEKLKADC